MSLKLFTEMGNRLNALEKQVKELEKRLEKQEQRKKPGPKPKNG